MNKKGLTLTEVLISSVIVAIVVMGVVSLDSVVGKKRQIASSESLLALRTKATVNHIIKNALQAVGNGNNERKGFLIGEEVGDQLSSGPGSFCINQDIKPSETEVNFTLLDDSDNRWACYSFNPTDNNITFCQMPYDATVSYRGAGRCYSGEVIGQAVSWNPQFNIEKEEGLTKLSFTMRLTTRYNPAKAKSTSNPENTVTVSSSPPGHSI